MVTGEILPLRLLQMLVNSSCQVSFVTVPLLENRIISVDKKLKGIV